MLPGSANTLAEAEESLRGFDRHMEALVEGVLAAV